MCGLGGGEETTGHLLQAVHLQGGLGFRVQGLGWTAPPPLGGGEEASGHLLRAVHLQGGEGVGGRLSPLMRGLLPLMRGSWFRVFHLMKGPRCNCASFTML